VPQAAHAPAQLATMSFTSPGRGYGRFTAQHGGRCTAAVGATTDGGRRFTRPALVTSWPCARTAPAAALTAGDLWHTSDGGAHWQVVYPQAP